MSYYNEMHVPIKNLPDDVDGDNYMVFFSHESGFDNMVKLIGEEYVQKTTIDYTEKTIVVFEQVQGGTDYIRPSDLDWQWHDNPTFYSYADCFIFVHDLHNRIDWSKCDNVDNMEKSLYLYQKHVEKHGNKLVIFPV